MCCDVTKDFKRDQRKVWIASGNYATSPLGRLFQLVNGHIVSEKTLALLEKTSSYRNRSCSELQNCQRARKGLIKGHSGLWRPASNAELPRWLGARTSHIRSVLDTITVAFSTKKAVSTVSIAMLADRGRPKYDDLVSKH
ncbi:hypothetical protein COOONC_16076 [Cooperia oncophora]